MRIFLTGATGLIGGRVAAVLKLRGHAVTVLVRNETAARSMQALGYEPIVGDLANPAGWQAPAAAAEGLMHLALVRPGRRLNRRWIARARAVDRIAFDGLAEAARRGRRCRALAYTSGISIYGDHRDAWIDEDAELRPGAIGGLKRDGEYRALLARRAGLPVFCLRPGLVYANAGVFRDFFLLPAARGKFACVGSGRAFHSFVHIDDIAEAYALAMENPPVGATLNLTDDEPLRWTEFAAALLGALGDGPAKHVPAWLVALLAGGPLVEMLTSSYRVSNARAKARLGWKLRHSTFREGIRTIVADFRTQSAGGNPVRSETLIGAGGSH